MRWLTVLIVLMLAGCASVQQAAIKQAADEAKAQLDAAQAECDRLHPDKYKRPVTPRIKCLNVAVEAYSDTWDRTVSGSGADIAHAFRARRLVAAERYDKGEISQAEYDLELANNHMAAISHEKKRNNDAAAVRAATAAAAAALYPTTTTNCSPTFGGGFNCTTH